MKYTPGPWKAYDSSERSPLPAGPPVEVGTEEGDGGRFGTICEMVAQGTDGKYDQDVTWGNARLIAAGPTMYAYIEKKAAEGDADAQGIIASIAG